MPSEEGMLQEVAQALCQAKGLRFLNCAGGGSFKRVYKAETCEGNAVAVKILIAKSLRTEREVEALQRCSHPNIAILLESGTVALRGANYDYQVEEFCAGGSLHERIADRWLSPNAAHWLGYRLLGALHHLSTLGLVHRDIKPANIMYRQDGAPVLVDFGLVRDLGRSSLTVTWAMQGPGTPFFAPPEQLNNDKDQINWWSDQFSLGVCLLYAATGLHPYQYPGEETPERAIERVANRQAPRRDLGALCESLGLSCLPRMVQPWPINRYRKCVKLIEEWGPER